jgi:hypothetical protein
MPRIRFNGEDTFTHFTVSVIAEHPDGTFTIVHPALDANNDFDYTVPEAWATLQYVGVVVTNSKRSGGRASYALEVLDETGAVGVQLPVASSAGSLELEPNAPNPFRGSTRIAYSLAEEGWASLRVVDVTGRVVRTLVDGRLPAGPGEVTWDGRDLRGRPVPAGVYWVRLLTREEARTRKMTLLR